MEFNAFLSALPSAATSPYAFAGYVGLVASWLIIGLRVKRNKNLLDALEKIPEDQRLSALKAEMGNVDPPSGLTAQEWLKSRIHSYYFICFVVFLICLTVLAVVAYVLTPENPAKKVSADVGLYSDSKSNTIEGRDMVSLQYQTKRVSEHLLEIMPAMPYLDNLASDREVHGFQYWYEPFHWDFPVLSVKVVNNSKSTILISEIQFDVVDSVIDFRSVPLIHENFYNLGKILFVNEGWGAMQDPVLNITGWKKPNVDPREILFRWQFGDTTQDPCQSESAQVGGNQKIKLDAISAEINVPVEQYIPTELRSEPIVCALGFVSYKNSIGSQSFRFRTMVSRFNPPPGAPAPPTATYDLFLSAGKKGYTATVPVSQAIEPGKVDHFTIKVSSDKSAAFVLKYHTRALSDIDLPGETLKLSMFIPRSSAEQGELDSKRFPELPKAVWGGLPQASSIDKIVYKPDDKSDIRIFLKVSSDQAQDCDGYYDAVIDKLRNAPFPDSIHLALVDSKGVMFCTSGMRSLTSSH